MDVTFERFSKYVKDEFGLTVTKKTSQERTSFESLFGVSAEELFQSGTEMRQKHKEDK